MLSKGQPMVLLLAALAFGILAGYFKDEFVLYCLLAVGVAFSCLVWLYFKANKGHLLGLFVWLMFFGIGYYAITFSFLVEPNDLSKFEEILAWKGKITSISTEKRTQYQAVLEVDTAYLLQNKNLAKASCSGKVIVRFSKDKQKSLPEIGSYWLINGPAEIVSPPKNPGEFNYQQYLVNQGIHFQQRADSFKAIGSKAVNPVLYYSVKARNWGGNIIGTAFKNSNVKGIALGLTLGIKDYLDSNTTGYFQDTGTLHALAVSGAHLQIVFFMLSLVLGSLKIGLKNKLPFTILVLLGVWFFAFVTGWSASVIRAALMFTVLIVGQLQGYHKHSWNQIALSAFILLLINPLYLFDVGFQLSYTAIAGIVLVLDTFEVKTYNLPKTATYILNLSLVTIGATLGTTFISVYYFHQFPTWFLPANLIVVPVTGVLLPLTLIGFPIYHLPIVGTLYFQGLEIGYSLLIAIVKWFAELPFATIDYLYIDGWQCLLLYIMTFAFIGFFIKPHKSGLIVLLTTALLFVGVTTYNFWKWQSKSELIVWHQNRKVSITVRNLGQTHLFTTDSLLPFEKSAIENYAEGNFSESILKQCFKLKVGIHCIHYQSKVCNPNCLEILNQNSKPQTRNAIYILPYTVIDRQGNYQTFNKGAFKMSL